MKKLLPVLFLTIFLSCNFAQVKVESIGGYLGLGSIQGNSTPVTTFTTSVFIDTKFFFSEYIAYRFSFFYSRKFEALIASNSRAKYFPFHRAFSIKGVIAQPLGEFIFLEEGIGLIMINDRTFSDTNVWAFGTAFHLLAGLDFRNENNTGFKLGVGSEVALTFNNTTPQFFSAHIQTAYYF